MPHFEYEAINIERYRYLKGLYKKPGQLDHFIQEFGAQAQIVSGIMEALTPEEVRDKLNDLGYHPLRLNLVIRDRQGIYGLDRYKKKLKRIMEANIDKREIKLKLTKWRWPFSLVDMFVIGVLIALLYLALAK